VDGDRNGTAGDHRHADAVHLDQPVHASPASPPSSRSREPAVPLGDVVAARTRAAGRTAGRDAAGAAAVRRPACRRATGAGRRRDLAPVRYESAAARAASAPASAGSLMGAAVRLTPRAYPPAADRAAAVAATAMGPDCMPASWSARVR